MRQYDHIVIGAGIAGASAAFELSAHGRVLVLEQEAQPGYHATGRSAAIYTQVYGEQAVRALTIASLPFFTEPPQGFASVPLLSPLGCLRIGRQDQMAQLDAFHADGRALGVPLRRLDHGETLKTAPILRPDQVHASVLEAAAAAIDVDALHQGFLRGLRERGGEVLAGAETTAISRRGGAFVVEAGEASCTAPVLVNAAGAWADATAVLAGAGPVGVIPCRRTAILIDPPAGLDLGRLPMVVDIDEQFYFKPEAGKLMASPGDETPSPACDARPDELDIAICADRLQAVAALEISRIGHAWAGLRSFARDRLPVVGFDPRVEGFFWLAGQGGYGLQTAPAMARLTAALVQGQSPPGDLLALGVTEPLLSPGRFACGAA